MTRAISGIARVMRGRAEPYVDAPAEGYGVRKNRIWSSADVASADSASGRSAAEPWGTRPDRPSEFVIDVKADPQTIAGLTALGFGDEAQKLADPFRVVVNRSGLFFYSYGDRKVLDLWIRWSSLTGLAVTDVRSSVGFLGSVEVLHAIAVTGIAADGTAVTFPLIAREPGSGFGAAIGLSSAREQQHFIDRIDRFYAERPPVVDS